jgi:hypothetical protein
MCWCGNSCAHLLPASMSETRKFGSRLASTHSAVPPPTMTTSYSSTMAASNILERRCQKSHIWFTRQVSSVCMARQVRRQVTHRPPAIP